MGKRRNKKKKTPLDSGKTVSTPDGPGRVVITHSTYVPGLIPLLEKLALVPGVQTITPAVISRVKSHSPQFRLKVSVPIQGGHKLIARKAKTAQEVFVVTTLSREALEREIASLLS